MTPPLHADMNGPDPLLQLLVVDDDEVDRERVVRYLRRTGLQVRATEAATGEEALKLVDRQPFDCIVMDNQLGDTTGSALLRRLRLAHADLCPVIMVTGAGNEALVVQALQDGAADYLTKVQLNPDLLGDAIQRSIARHQEQRQQAALVRRRERDLQDFLDHTSSLIAYCDASEQLRFGNRAFQQWFALTAERLASLSLRELMGDSAYGMHTAHIAAALRGETRSFEHSQASPVNGATREMQVQYRPDLDEDGHSVQGIYITLNDVTPVKAAQSALTALLRFMQDVVDRAPVGIAVYSGDGHCLLANVAMARILDTDSDALMRLPLSELAREEHRELAMAARATLADGQTRHAAQSHTSQDDRQTHVAWSLARIERSDEPCLVTIARDVTEQQALHASLVRARNAAEEAARVKSAFLANMSHEIRTPMNAIVGLSRLVLESELPDAAREQVDRVHESAIALMGILDDILDYSKVEAGQLHLEDTEVQLEEVLQRVADLFAGRMLQKRIGLTIELAPDLPGNLRGDPLRLSQILNNLVGNAVKFTDHGGVHLALRAEDAGQTLRCEVRDSGIGIDEAKQQTLFSPFAQADVSITRRYGGSGLGLAICKRLVDMMGGQIGVTSTPGQGSTFWFTLPLRPIAAASATPTEALWRVLLIGDDRLHGHALVPVLQRAQVETALQAPDAATMVERLQQQPHLGATIDALVVDWSGETDTFDQRWLLTLKAIAQLPAGTPVLHMSPPEVRPRLHELLTGQPQACLLSHPVLPRNLHKALQRACQSSAPPPSMSPAPSQPWLHAEALLGREVLLVEDNPLNQMVAQAFLEQAGMVVTTLDNGEKAVQEMKRVGAAHYALILMDMHMPVMDGLEATRRIRGLEGCGEIPVIAMTAAVLPADKALCRDAGMDDFVTKPVLPEALIATLLRWVPPAEGSAP